MTTLRTLFQGMLVVLAVAATTSSCGSPSKATDDATVTAPDAAAKPQCSDGIDNDGDGKIDYPDDPGCTSPLQDDETDDCPNGPHCPQCANGIDDNNNGLIDYPNDPGCYAASDPDENMTDPAACGTALLVNNVTFTDGLATATGILLTGGTSYLSSTNCGGAGSEVPYQITLDSPAVLTATTDNGGSTVDTVLYLRSTCQSAASEITCNDDDGTAHVHGTSRITANLAAGTYFLIVDSATTATGGGFLLTMNLTFGSGAACTTQAECSGTFVCKVPVTAPTGTTDKQCSTPSCSDGIDNDGDGKIDFPNDPGCSSPADDDESDDCQTTDLTCPQCGDGIDNNNNGLIDYPADPGCRSAGQPIEGCGTEQDPFLVATSGVTTGTTIGAHDDFDPSCAEGFAQPDVVVLATIPALDTLNLDTTGSQFDTVLAVYPSSCTGELACNDDNQQTFADTSLLNMSNVAAGTYAIVVDGGEGFEGPTSGIFTLNLSGTIRAGGRCDGELALSGALVCSSDSTCTNGVCIGTKQCNDGIDNDGDGLIDFPNDPGCTSPDDDDETDDCQTTKLTCPQCGDGIDNDGDGLIDYPADPSCLSASGTSESCTSTEPIAVITTAVTAGDTTNATNDVEPGCQFTPNTSGPDLTYELDLPALTSLTVSASGEFDIILDLFGASCVAPELACQDNFDPSITQSHVTAGRYYLVVDGDSGESGAFSLSLSGTMAIGALCESPLTDSGAFVCPSGYACKGVTGSKTCALAACHDGIDNDGDGKTDYPQDPGCSSPSDDDETDDCQTTKLTCPQCSDGIDNDNNGVADYPADPGCAFAGQEIEGCDVERDPIIVATTAATFGNTSGAHDDFEPTCGESGSPDITVFATVPALDSLTADTNGSSFDTVLSVYPESCAGQLACNDDGGGPNNSSSITMTTVTAGNYAFVVDGFGSGAFELNLTGTITTGGDCDGVLAKAGVFACATGATCTGGDGTTGDTCTAM